MQDTIDDAKDIKNTAHDTENSSTQKNSERHNYKMRRKKEVRDRILATKTIEKGLLIVHTGKGKGKSTAAFGIIFRTIGNGEKAAVVQYVKGAWQTGEKKILQDHFSDHVAFYAMGEGFTWETQDRDRDIAAAEKAWEKSKQLIIDPSYKVVLLDELNIVLRYGYLDNNTVLDFIAKNRAQDRHLIITGRNASPELIEMADLVTEMEMIKHPFRSGIKAQPCIEF